MNKAHEQIPDGGSAQGLIEEGVFSVEDTHLQGTFAYVVVERGAGYTEEKRQLIPVIPHVFDGLP